MIQIIGIGLIAFVLFVVQKYIYKNLWNQNLYANISFASSSIFEGQEGYLKEIVENRKHLPLSMLKVKFQTSRYLVFEDSKGSRTTDQYYRNDIFQVNGGEKITRTISFTGGKRGYYSISSMDMVAMDLFMTSQFMDTLPISTFIYVYPKIFDSKEFRRSLQQLNGEVLTKRHLLEDPFEYRGIREYQPTDDMRSINWKATAKTGELKINQKNYTALQAVRVFINLEDDGILKREECVEACLQIAAGLCDYFLKQGIRVSCFSNGVDLINDTPVSIDASAARGQMEVVLRSLARIDTKKPVVDFNSLFAKKLLEEANGTITCFVSPNHYQRFLDLVTDYHNLEKEYMWFYPILENKEPELPTMLQKNVHFLHLQDMKKTN